MSVNDDFFEEFFNDTAKAAMNEETNWRACSPDCPPCAICKKLIVQGCPLRAFRGEGTGMREIAFHHNCAVQPGVTTDDDEDEDPCAVIECAACEQLSTCPHLSDEERKKRAMPDPAADLLEEAIEEWDEEDEDDD